MAPEHPRPWPRSAPTPFHRDQGMLSGRPVGAGRMLPWSLLLALPPESLLWPTLTCFDLLRLGLLSGGRTHPASGPCCQPQLGPQADFLGMVLPLKTESQNQPKTSSKLGLQLTQTTTDWPEALAYPLQPYPTDTSDTGKKSSFPWFGESRFYPSLATSPPWGSHLSQALRHTPCTTSLPHTVLV